MRSWLRPGALRDARGPGRLDGTRDLHSGGPIAVVNQRAERTSPAGQQAIPLMFISRQAVVLLAAINALTGDWSCCGRHAPSL